MENVKVRINKYDNIKGFAIFLIVFGHFNVMDTLDPFFSKLILLTGLPLFFFVSGYFSKIGPDEPLKAFRRLLIPYILFIILTNVFRFVLNGDPIIVKDMFISNISIFWFLIALFFMKMMLPIVDKFRYPLLVSIICALLIGFLDINYSILGITRFAVYFPLFLLGFYYNSYKDKLEADYAKYVYLFKRYNKIIVIFAAIFVLAVAYFIFSTIPFLFKVPYGNKILTGVIKRVLILISEFIVVLLFNRYMTNRKCILTTWGINSLTVYLLHYFVYLYINPILKVFPQHEIKYLPLVLILTFCVTFILSRNIFTVAVNKFTDFFYYLIVKKENVYP